MSDNTNTTAADTAASVAFTLTDDILTSLRDRTTAVTVPVEITPRDVALLASLANGSEQTDMADDYLCHRQTILKVVNRLYAKLGVSKAPAAVNVAGTAGAFKFTDGALPLDQRQALYAADKSWANVGSVVLTDTRSKPETDGEGTSNASPVETRQATPDEQQENDKARAEAVRKSRQASGVKTDS